MRIRVSVDQLGASIRGEASDQQAWASAAVLVVLVVISGLIMTSRVDPALTDSLADWLVASSAVDGLDPWDDLLVQSEHYGVKFARIGDAELGPGPRIHPRTPGTLVLLAPLSQLSPQAAYPTMVGLISVTFVGFAVWFASQSGWGRREWVLLASVGLTGSVAYTSTLEFGTHAVFVAAAAGTGLVLTRRSDSALGGVMLGLTVTLRMFPALLLVPLLVYRRFRALALAGMTFLALNLLGLIVFQLDVSDAAAALGNASRFWISFGGNGSLAMPLARAGLAPAVLAWFLPIVAVAMTLWVSIAIRHWPDAYQWAFAVATILALLVSPLSWEHYDVLAFLVLGYIVHMASRAHDNLLLSLAIMWVLVQLSAQSIDRIFSTPAFSWSGTISLFGRLFLLVVLLMAMNRYRVKAKS